MNSNNMVKRHILVYIAPSHNWLACKIVYWKSAVINKKKFLHFSNEKFINHFAWPYLPQPRRKHTHTNTFIHTEYKPYHFSVWYGKENVCCALRTEGAKLSCNIYLWRWKKKLKASINFQNRLKLKNKNLPKLIYIDLCVVVKSHHQQSQQR